jgi:hypothetical protein
MKCLSLLFCMSILLVIVLGVSLVTHKAEASSGLVGYWSFDEGAGTTAYDSSGNGNNGTLINSPVWSAGKYGSALTFDGTTNYVEMSNSSVLNNANFTIEAWIFINADVNQTQARIVSKQETGSKSYSFDIFGNGYGGSTGNQLLLSIGTGATWINFLSTTHLSNRTWYHVAGTQEGTSSKIYINGQLDKNGTTATQTTDNNGVLTVGCQKQTGTSTTFFFNGTIDDVRIYNRALSQQEIQGDMAVPEFPTLLLAPLFMIATLVALLVCKKKEKLRREPPLPQKLSLHRHLRHEQNLSRRAPLP